MTPFGSTRTRVRARHAIIAPDGHMDDAVPGWRGASTTVLISPRLGAGFTQVRVDLRPGGGADFADDGLERFLFVADGAVRVGSGADARELGPGGFALLPAGAPAEVAARGAARLALIERPYRPHAAAPAPGCVFGDAAGAPSAPFLGLDGVRGAALLPDAPAFDLSMTLMTYRPGAALPLVETHEAEHGLLLLSGGGILRLGDDWYPVEAGDAVWMGPYCPQWFAAIGDEDATYLMYKDGRRGPWEGYARGARPA